VLTLAYVFSFIDRQILSLLVEPIQRDLAISDKKLSLLMGPSFAVFYTLFGIPLGRLADTRNRRNLVAAGIAFWSLMTAACGVTRTFWQLALGRMGVGVGEATLSPSAYSLISDYFRPERRSTAMGVYSMGIYLGSGLSFILGGLVVKFALEQESIILPVVGPIRSWQMVFLYVGLPGLAVAMLLFTIREPLRRGLARAREGQMAAHASLREVRDYLSDNWATFVFLNLGMALITLNAYGAVSWIPAMFARRHGWKPEDAGFVFGMIVAIGGMSGVVAGGRLADWLNERGHADANVRVALLGAVGWLPFGIAFPLVQVGNWAAVVLAPAIFFSSMPFGVAPAAFQKMMPNTMRAQATAVYLFVINLIGMGLGPTVVATLTEDYFHDKRAVHYSLLVVGAAAHATACVLLWLSLRHYRASLVYFNDWNSRHVSPVIPQ
jgi:MFS family permease